MIKAHETTGLWFCVVRHKFSIWPQEVSEGSTRCPAFIQRVCKPLQHWSSAVTFDSEQKALVVSRGDKEDIPVSAVVSEGTWSGTIMSRSSRELLWPPPLFAFLNSSAVFCTPFRPMRIALCPGSISLPQISYHRTISSLSYFHCSNLS